MGRVCGIHENFVPTPGRAAVPPTQSPGASNGFPSGILIGDTNVISRVENRGDADGRRRSRHLEHSWSETERRYGNGYGRLTFEP